MKLQRGKVHHNLADIVPCNAAAPATGLAEQPFCVLRLGIKIIRADAQVHPRGQRFHASGHLRLVHEQKHLVGVQFAPFKVLRPHDGADVGKIGQRNVICHKVPFELPQHVLIACAILLKKILPAGIAVDMPRADKLEKGRAILWQRLIFLKVFQVSRHCRPCVPQVEHLRLNGALLGDQERADFLRVLAVMIVAVSRSGIGHGGRQQAVAVVQPQGLLGDVVQLRHLADGEFLQIHKPCPLYRLFPLMIP